MTPRWLPPIWAAVALALAVGARPVRAQTAWYEGFEGPQTSWRPAAASVRHRVEVHQRAQGEAHIGQGCERLRISGTGEGYVYFAHDVGHPRVIDELLPTVWVKADRPGVQILVRVVLPRAREPRTGRLLATNLGGSGYTLIGSWQQLRVDNLSQRLVQQARLLQSQVGVVDIREAYVDGILLNVYGGPGTTNVWIDDLDIAGYVEMPANRDAGGAAGLQAAPSSPPIAANATPSPMPAAVPQGTESPAGDQVKLEGSILLVDDRHLLPRVIQHQGEPLAFLRDLGFNAIWFAQPPGTETLEEAGRLGLWVVCPPPLAPGPPADGAVAVIGPGFRRVLAWDLGSRLTSEHLEGVRQWADQVRAADRGSDRPLICWPESDLWAYSHAVNLLVIGRAPLGTSLELADYGTWVRERPRLARLGTPVWTTVQTQPARSLLEQWAALGRGEPPPTAVANEQLRLLVYTAIAAGSRGLVFQSDSRLDATDPDTRTRAMTLELLNLELDLAEPWVAAGQWADTVPGNVRETQATMLRTKRAGLLIPTWSAPGAQFVAGQAAAHGVSFVVPVPESYSTYEITPGGLKPLRKELVTGGTRVTLDEFGLTALVLLTQDALAIDGLKQRARAVGPRAAQLQRQLAADKLGLVEQVHARLSARSPVPQASEWIATAKKSLQSCDGLLAARDYAGACLNAQRAMRPLRLLERAHWQAAVAPLRRPVASPAAVSFRTLPWHQEMTAFVAASQPGPNQLPGGDFEDLGTMLQSGWRRLPGPTSGVRSECELLPGAAHAGRFGLRLAAQAKDRHAATMLIESPPVWMVSPDVPVTPGCLIRIQGWVQVPAAITGSVDGLLILDSITGEPLAERIDETTGWTQFTLYRVATQSGRVSVAFALSGMGEAWVDDVTIQQLDPRSPDGASRLHSSEPRR